MMKAKFLFAAVALSAMAVSCTLEPLEQPVQDGQLVVFTATAAQSGTGTKTTLVNDGPDIFWSPNDEIMIYNRTWGLGTMISNNTEPAQTAEFPYWIQGTVGAVSEGNEFWALTPVNWNTTFDGESVKTPMPSIQTTGAGTYDPASLLTIARSSSLSLSFYNVCGGVKFKVMSGTEDVNERISFVEFLSNDGTPLAGNVTVKMDGDGIPYVDEIENPSNVISLTAPGGGSFEPNVWYYLVCLPAVLENGFTLTFCNGKGEVASYVRTDPTEVKRSVWGVLTNPDEGLDWEISNEPKYNEIWYTTEDGNPLNITNTEAWSWGANLVSNEMSNGVFCLTFDGPVTNIPNWGAFQESDLTSIVLPRAVRTIEGWAFNIDEKLKSVTLSEGLIEIGDYAFQNNSALTELYIPGSVTRISGTAFSGCSLTFTGPLVSEDGHCLVTKDGTLTAFMWKGEEPYSYVVPEGIVRLGDRVFRNQYLLEEITLPLSLTEIGSNVFQNCNNLRAIHGPFASEDGHLLIQDGELKGVALAGVTELIIPGSVITIPAESFWYCGSLESVIMEDGVTTIGNRAFLGCFALTEVTFPESLVEIGDGAFSDCQNLEHFSGKFASEDGRLLIKDGKILAAAIAGMTELVIPGTVNEIGASSFYNHNSLESLTIEEGVTKIGDAAFENCSSLTEVTLPQSLVEIGVMAFSYCRSIERFSGKFASDDGLCLIYNGALINYALGNASENIVIPDYVTRLGRSVFEGVYGVKSITVPGSVKTIDEYVFWSCGDLESIVLSEGIQTIDNQAFSYCESLTSVTLPSTVTRVGWSIFQNCTELNEVTILAETPPATNGNPLYEGWDKPIYVPANAVENYMASWGWSAFADYYQGITE